MKNISKIFFSSVKYKLILLIKRKSRVYHYHIRKTGGTSINHAFLSLLSRDSKAVYLALAKKKKISFDVFSIIGWNKSMINSGKYLYAFSHEPYHEIIDFQNTFTFTCFRDPCARVISHYRMLLEMQASNSTHPCMRTEAPWLGRSFEDFLSLIPKEHLLNQLWMFSSSFSISEACHNISNLNCVLYTENIADGIRQLANKTGLPLQARHDRKTSHEFVPSDFDLENLRDRLEPEYQMLNRVRAIF